MKSKIKEVVLENGLRIFLEHLPYYEKCAVRIGIKAGSRDEPEDKSGIFHLIEHMFFKSNKFRSMKKIHIDLERRGTDRHAGTDDSTTEFCAQCLPRSLPDIIEIIFGAISNFEFDDDEVEKAKKQSLTELKDDLDQPSIFQFDKVFIPAIFGKTVLSNPMIGSPEKIAQLSKHDIVDFKRKFYQPKNMAMVVSGRFNETKLLNKLESGFGGLTGEFYNIHQPIAKIDNRRHWMIKRKEGIKQVYLTIGLPILDFYKMNNETVAALYLWCALMCGGSSTRLSYRLCEEEGDVYHISADLENWGGAGEAHIMIEGFSPSKFSKILDIIFEEIRSVSLKSIKKGELEIAKEIFLSNYLDRLQDLNFCTEEILKSAFGFSSYDFRSITKEVKKMNSRKFHRIIRKHLPYSRRKWTVSVLAPPNVKLEKI